MMRNYPRLLPYVVAIGSTAIALLVRLSLESLLSETIGGFFYIAILISTWYGGSRPGIVTVVLSALAIKYFFLSPRYQFWIFQPQNLLQLSLFLLVALIINRLTSNFLNSKQKIQQLGQKLAQENAEQLRMALTAAHMGMWDWDIVSGEIKWSPEHEELFGMAVGTFDGRYETFAAYIHPDDRSALNQAVQQALQTHSIYQHEYRIIWADGSIHWLEARGQAFYDAVGQPVRMTGTVMAIDQHKQIEAALQQSERRYRSLVHASAQIVWRTDADGKGIDTPKGWQELTGQTAAENLGWGWLDTVHPDDRDRALQTWEEAYRNRTLYETEFRLRMKDGNYRDFTGRGVPILDVDGEISEWIGTCTDITQQKQIEAALRQSEQRYRSLVHTSAQIVWRTDANGMATVTPEGWEEFTGQPAAEQQGWGWLDTVHPDDRDRTAQCWQESYTNRTFYETECRLRSKDGNYRDFAVRGVPILDVDGNINEWIGTCTDITERKQAEVALKESQIQLQRQLAEIETIYQSAPIGLSILDTDLRFVRINERLAEINGFSVAAHIGRTVRELLPDLADVAEQMFHSILETGAPILKVEITGQTPAQPGVQRTWLESFLPLKDGERIIGISTVCEEITERKQAQEALRQSEERYRTLFESIDEGFCVIEMLFDEHERPFDYRFLEINPTFEKQTGLKQALGKTARQLVPNLEEHWFEIYGKVALTGESIRFEHGSAAMNRWFDVYALRVGQQSGRKVALVFKDITERKQAEMALQQMNTELEQRVAERTLELTQVNDRLLAILMQQHQARQLLEEQAQLLDLAHDTIITRDLNGAISFWNRGAEDMYGWKKGEALGEILHTLLKTQFPQPLAEIEAELSNKGYWEGELIHFSRDATPITVASRWVLQTDKTGKPIKILEINNDITKRKQAELALSQSEERRRLALDLTHTAFWDLHLPTRNMVWNDNHFTLLGLAPYSVEPSYEVWRNRIHPEDIGWVEQLFLESIEARSDYTAEYRVVHPDGSVHWMMGRGRAIYDESGQPLRSVGVLLDISDRKQAEQALRQYERIVSSSKDSIALVNRNYIYQIVNQAYLDWCNKSDIEVLGNYKRDVLGEKLFDSVIQSRLNRCLAGETIQYEQWFDYPNLVPQFMSVTYTPYREPDGSISGVIVSLRDLTRLKQAEQMLELQAVITRNMAEGIGLVRADNGVIVYANPKFEQMFGYDSGELNGQHVSIVNYASESVNPEDVNQAIRSAVLQKGEATYEVHNVKKDGTPFWCSATTSVFSHPDYGDVMVAVHQDITERKRIEDALRESEEKFRQLAENIQAVFWMTDLQNQQSLYVSKAYEKIWQRSCQSLYQNSSTWLEAIHPDDRQRVEILLIEQVKTGKSDIKYRIIRPDGSIRWIRDRAFPIKNEVGKIVRIAGIAEDITELQKVEQMKTEFIGIVSHELRTPLTAIRAALGLLNSGIYDNKPDKFKRMIEIASIDSDRLVRLVNDILDLERLESGQSVLEKTTCEAADLIEQAVESVKAIAKQEHIILIQHPTDAKVWAAADAIIQTLTNLLSNAIKFSPPNSTITLSVQPQSDRVLFQISDRGRGIPAEKLELIFGRFHQVDATDSRDKGGTGLGLAICRSIIEQHGGQIWAQSTLGVGSTFFFTLPLPRK